MTLRQALAANLKDLGEKEQATPLEMEVYINA